MALKRFKSSETAWCPGCGNHSILTTQLDVLEKMNIQPRNLVLVGGIGQAPKLNQYVNANGFSGLHGRALPAAVAMKMANHTLTIVVNSGDGDTYGEGGNHFIHNIRRNADITHFVHNNQIYGLTKGQVSPTSSACDAQPGSACNLSLPLNPLQLALAAGCTFAARAFSGNTVHLAQIMQAAIEHKGYALVDILQPCISFNKVNTFGWYNQRVYELESAYTPNSLNTAFERAGEWGEKIPIGIFYRASHPTYHEQHPGIYGDAPIVKQKPAPSALGALMDGYVK